MLFWERYPGSFWDVLRAISGTSSLLFVCRTPVAHFGAARLLQVGFGGGDACLELRRCELGQPFADGQAGQVELGEGA